MPTAPNAARGVGQRAMVKWQRALVWVLGLLTVVVACVQAVFYFTRTVDDLFISLRYAENFAAGRGLVYNLDERVEGFSSPLWVFLQSGGLWLGGDGLTVTKLCSMASLVLLLGCCYWYGRHIHRVRPAVAWLILTGLVSNSYLLSWALLGLETPLYLTLLVCWPLALRRQLAASSRRGAVAAVVAGVALGMARPEAPLYLVTLLLAVVLPNVGTGAGRRRLRSLGGAVATVFGLLAVLELGRRLYFGAWVAHTYHAKRGPGFDLGQLSALFGQGAHPVEVFFLVIGACAAVWLAVGRRDWVPACCWLTNAAFACSVVEDWMPNQRHYLPLWVYCTLAVGVATERLLQVSRGWRIVGAFPVAVIVCNVVQQFSIDSRYSRQDFHTHGRQQHWVRVKDERAWRDGWLALRRRTPPHVERMSVSSMGMIQQLYRVLETSTVAESESWYVGRDIGRVGYYSPIRVFDTDGLFTPAVWLGEQWSADHQVSAELARRAFAERPVAVEVYGDWSAAVGGILPELHDYDILSGSRRRPVVLQLRAPRPTPQEILSRYRRVAAKLPSWFHISTLYGECVGAAFEKRYAFVRTALQHRKAFTVKQVPPELAARGVVFEREGIRLHGCRFSADRVVVGGGAELSCYFEARSPPNENLSVFVHLLDAKGRRRLVADHEPCGGFCPTTQWPVGRVVHDRVSVTVPAGLDADRLIAHLGLFRGPYRARPVPAELTDGDNRVVGPVLRVQR